MCTTVHLFLHFTYEASLSNRRNRIAWTQFAFTAFCGGADPWRAQFWFPISYATHLTMKYSLPQPKTNLCGRLSPILDNLPQEPLPLSVVLRTEFDAFATAHGMH